MNKQIITLSNRAADRVKEIMAQAKEPVLVVLVVCCCSCCLLLFVVVFVAIAVCC